MRSRGTRGLRRAATLALIVSAGGCAVASPPPRALAVGDPAPALELGEWLRGEPIADFAKGRIYVVEMWATWCGPCIAAIPHLTELARRHRDDGVVVVAVNVMDPDPAAVRAFVAEAGARIDFRVARDAAVAGDEVGAMARAWLPEGRSIPSCVIVDRDTRVAWAGHPLRAEGPLGALVAGTFDAARQAEIERMWVELGERYGHAAKEKRWDDAAALLDRMDAVDPSGRSLLVRQRIAVALGGDDYAAAERIAREVLSDQCGAPSDLQRAGMASDAIVALLMAREPSRLDLDFILAEAKKAADDGRSDNPRALGALARAYMAKGAIADAVGVWRRMIEACGPMVNREGLEGLIKDAEAKGADRREVTTDPGR